MRDFRDELELFFYYFDSDIHHLLVIEASDHRQQTYDDDDHDANRNLKLTTDVFCKQTLIIGLITLEFSLCE